MADKTAAAESTDSGGGGFGGGDGVQRAPVSTEMTPEEQAIFDKHFGEGPDDDDEPAPKAKPKPKAPPAKDAKSKEKPEPKKDAKPEPKGKEKPAAADDDDDDDDEPAGDDEPEEAKVTKKARELFAKAKEAKNPADARRFYKQAMKEAFGEIPEEFNDARYASARQADRARAEEHAKKDQELEQKAANIQASADKWVQQLAPAYRVMQVLKKVENGDWTALGDLIEQAGGGIPRDEALKRFTRGIRETPEAVQARRRQAQVQETESAALKRIAELEKKLEEKDAAKEAEAKKARIAARRAAYTEEVGAEIAAHPVTKLPNGIERVVRYLIATADPKLRAPKYSPEEAADRVYAIEKRRLKQLREVIPDDDAPPPAREDRRAPAVSRSQSTEPGRAPAYDPDEALDRIWARHNPPKRRR